MCEKYPHRVQSSGHGGAMESGFPDFLIAPVWVEATGEKRLDSRGIASFRGPVKHRVMLCCEFGAQIRVRGEQGLRRIAIASAAGGHEPVDRTQLCPRAAAFEPVRDSSIAVEFG